jgi:monoamine oxidase
MYDIVIIGGGIAGLNAAYELQKYDEKIKILILERNQTLGGRIFTYKDKNMTVEAGAGRFHLKQENIIQLISELKLKSKIKPTSSSAVYAPIQQNTNTNTNSNKTIEHKGFQNSLLDNPYFPSDSYFDPLFNMGLDIFLGTKNMPIAGLITKVIIRSKITSNNVLINTSFENFAKNVLTPQEIQYVKDSFGYYSELVIMNAKDAIDLMENNLSPNLLFNVLSGGLSQLIENMYKKLKQNKNISIKTLQDVTKIYYDKNYSYFKIQTKTKDIYESKICICALPKQSIEKIEIFKMLKPKLKKIQCSPLCRIYCYFKPEKSGNVWFKNLPKLTTNNNLRMVIPMSEKDGTIMISYTDNKFAEYWNKLEKTKGIQGVNKELTRLIKQSLNVDMPEPEETKIFYWDCGVGYWGIGADSKKLSQELLFPFNDIPIYICGEHYSHKNQQWIEGALETSKQVVDDIINNNY